LRSQSQFDLLVDDLREASSRRRSQAARAARERVAFPARPQDFRKAIAAQCEDAARNLLGGLRPGLGVRIEGRAGGFQIVDVEPGGQVQIRQVKDRGLHPVGENFDDATVERADPAALRLAPQFDAPGSAGTTFAKALEGLSTRQAQAARRERARADLRQRVAATKAKILAAVRDGKLTAQQAAMLDAVAHRSGI
jgi:hypothetical protein